MIPTKSQRRQKMHTTTHCKKIHQTFNGVHVSQPTGDIFGSGGSAITSRGQISCCFIFFCATQTKSGDREIILRTAAQPYYVLIFIPFFFLSLYLSCFLFYALVGAFFAGIPRMNVFLSRKPRIESVTAYVCIMLLLLLLLLIHTFSVLSLQLKKLR